MYRSLPGSEVLLKLVFWILDPVQCTLLWIRILIGIVNRIQ
jgi:hypothetical protein